MIYLAYTLQDRLNLSAFTESILQCLFQCIFHFSHQLDLTMTAKTLVTESYELAKKKLQTKKMIQKGIQYDQNHQGMI